MQPELPDLAPFWSLRPFISIAHQIPGRIRLKLDRRALLHLPKLEAAPYLAWLKRVPGLKATRVNAAALSVVVEYDPVVIAPSLWKQLLSAEPAAARELLAAHSA